MHVCTVMSICSLTGRWACVYTLASMPTCSLERRQGEVHTRILRPTCSRSARRAPMCASSVRRTLISAVSCAWDSCILSCAHTGADMRTASISDIRARWQGGELHLLEPERLPKPGSCLQQPQTISKSLPSCHIKIQECRVNCGV